MESALEIQTGQELERFSLGTVLINRRSYTVLTGHEGTGMCFWCGGELKGKLKRYCYGHMMEYYDHFEWGSASSWALKRSDYQCENCGAADTTIGTYYQRTNLEVHHIVPLKGNMRYFSAFNLPWNLIVFCHQCHQDIHAVMREAARPTPPDTFDLALARGQAVMELCLDKARAIR